jgi:dUTP pyrophosphatase
VVVDTGVHVGIPEGYVGMVKAKSGLNVRDGITCTGVIDAGYTGSIVVKLYSHSDYARRFDAGDKVAQLVVMPVACCGFALADSLGETERGDGGFGSTGR